MFFLAAGYQRPEGGREMAQSLCGKNAIKLLLPTSLLIAAGLFDCLLFFDACKEFHGERGGHVPAIKTLKRKFKGKEIKIKKKINKKRFFQRGEISSLGVDHRSI